MKLFFILSIIILFSCIAAAQEDTLNVKKVTLKDGSQLIGRIIAEDADKIRFKTSAGVEMEIKKDLIEKIENVESDVEMETKPVNRKYQIGDHELLIMPTA